MGIVDGLVVLGVFGGFGYMILSKLHQNNPAMADKIKGWFKGGLIHKSDSVPTPEHTEQVYDEKRTMM